MPLKITQIDNTVVFPVKVVPGSSRTRIAGLLDTAMKVNIAAPPERGKANKELTQFLAKLLGCSKSAITVVSGQTNPHKEIAITGMTANKLQSLLTEHLGIAKTPK